MVESKESQWFIHQAEEQTKSEDVFHPDEKTKHQQEQGKKYIVH